MDMDFPHDCQTICIQIYMLHFNHNKVIGVQLCNLVGKSVIINCLIDQ